MCVCACRHSPWCDSSWDALKRDLSRETWQRDMVQFNGTPPPHSLCLWHRQSRVEDHSLLVHDMLTHELNSDQSFAPCCGLRFGLGISVWLLPAPWICMSGNRKKNKTLLVIAFFLFCNAKSLIIMLYDYSGTFFLCLRDHQPSAQVIAHIDRFGLCFLKSWREKTQSSHLWFLFILKWK